MEILERSGAIGSFVKYMTEKRALVNSPRSALMISYIIGVVIFIESSITSLIAGAVGKPLCDREKVSRAKLAYVCDSTSAPISSLILFNGWGALLLGLIITQIESGMIKGDSVSLLIHAVVYNFYSISALIVTFVVVWFGLYTKSMEESQVYRPTNAHFSIRSAGAWSMLLPILFLVFSVFGFLYLTGDGDILKGSGSSSIFYTTVSTMIFMLILYVFIQNMPFKNYLKASYLGGKKLFPIAMVLLFAFAIGEVTSELKTGLYLASFASENINISLLAGVIFILSGIIAFSTGTSWGTFSIMIPIAVPMAVALDGDVALVIGAVISGGVFGDHCSPISDTTIISSLASGCDVVEHVKTQLPYALLSALIALVFFILFSL
ncbi:Na+/H+ antiporter NhaC family protein [Sulfurimonas marina]|uniref:Sodium:proton antiporter n=1 Tax=Sulfurimonas marina TaxID=2590551 RepID=A0A7M1AT10_9BACT|nr:Na+/H+ antiporter NhaC family protein [Sulfurimonas marina]QOP40547.1 sodium:proton antiporter [Sulfurimonas marina]